MSNVRSQPDLERLPFDWSVWYPLLNGGPGPCTLLPDGRSLTRLASGLAPGASLLLGSAHPGLEFAHALGSLRVLPRRVPGDCTFESFGAVPNTGGGFVLLAQGEREAFRAGLGLLPAGRGRWRVLRTLLEHASGLGLTSLPGAAQLGLLTRRGGAGRQPVVPELAGRVAAVARGVPGLHQKLSLALTPHADLPARIVKISLGAASERQVEREAQALEQASRFPGAALAPRLLASGSAHGRRYLVQERLHGRRSGDALGPAHLEFLARLQAVRAEQVPFEQLTGFAADAGYVARRGPRLDQAWRAAMEHLVESLQRCLHASLVPHSPAHGDFTPWNLVQHEGRVLAFDWEYAEALAPALHDLFHFETQTAVLVRREPARLLVDRVERLLAGPARGLVQGAQPEAQDSQHAWAAFALYVLHAAVQAERRHELERPAFAQVQWLRDAHIELASRIAGRLAARRRAAPEVAA